MNLIDFPIERFNQFLEKHTFWIDDPFNFGIDGSIQIKVKLTGISKYIVTGTWKEYISFTIEIIGASDDTTRKLTDMIIKDETIVKTYNEDIPYTFKQEITEVLSKVLTYFSLDEKYSPILTKVVKNFR